MRIFLDTNVILEYFLDREDGKTAGQLFTFLQEQKHSLFMTVGSYIFLCRIAKKSLNLQ